MNWGYIYEITGLFGKCSPVSMAIKLNVIDEYLIFFWSPRTFLQSHFLTAWSSHHFTTGEESNSRTSKRNSMNVKQSSSIHIYKRSKSHQAIEQWYEKVQNHTNEIANKKAYMNVQNQKAQPILRTISRKSQWFSLPWGVVM